MKSVPHCQVAEDETWPVAASQLPQPGLGDGQPEEGLGLFVGGGRQGLFEGVLGLA